jgi:hypothetical protein
MKCRFSQPPPLFSLPSLQRSLIRTPNLHRTHDITMLNDNKTSLSTSLDKSKAEIRLLHLQPRRGVDEITCTLQLANLDAKNCEYEALSYEWGDPTDASLVIWIDGETVPVRENLWWALWYLRYEERERVVWIDALCINQNDNKERQHQVSCCIATVFFVA